MGFRYSGTAWDGQKWVACNAITTLGKQIEKVRPGNFLTDGTVASQSHDQVSPNSDHTVWPQDATAGIVYAIDIEETSALSIDLLFDGFRKSRDARIKYCIHDRRMFSSYAAHGYPAWTWRPYDNPGLNPHTGHGHVSVHHTPSKADDGAPWIITTGEDMEKVIKDIQQNLNAARFTDKDGNPLKEDGIWGLKTKQAHKAMCKAAAESGAAPKHVEIKDGRLELPGPIQISGGILDFK